MDKDYTDHKMLKTLLSIKHRSAGKCYNQYLITH